MQVKKENKPIQLWIEGLCATGEYEQAQFLGTYNAKDLDDAVNQYISQKRDDVELNKFGNGRHAIWGRELYDNEKDARQSFG